MEMDTGIKYYMMQTNILALLNLTFFGVRRKQGKGHDLSGEVIIYLVTRGELTESGTLSKGLRT